MKIHWAASFCRSPSLIAQDSPLMSTPLVSFVSCRRVTLFGYIYWCSTPKRLCFQSSASFARMATGKWLKANRNSSTPSEPAQKSPASACSPWYSRLLVAGWADCEKEADSLHVSRETSGRSSVWIIKAHFTLPYRSSTTVRRFLLLVLPLASSQKPQVQIQNFWWWFLRSVWPDTETQRLHVYDIQNVHVELRNVHEIQ